jgi:enamine deaminase RidA (YjgF/YER057c/UK114 family)
MIEFSNPEELMAPKGFSHVALASGRLVFVAGQTAHQVDGTVKGETLEEQFAAAAANVVTALRAAGAGPEHMVWLQIFTTDVDDYAANLRPLGAAYRSAFGSHYPPMGLFGVTRLFDPAAKVELMAIAVIPEP